ncbi:MAG: Hpt domain-containing protein [Pseudomonadota bacterium]
MISWDRVNELREEVGEEFAEVVDIFLEEAEEALERIKSETDHSKMAEHVHFLKGCALNIGFEELGVTCQQTERALSDAASPVDHHRIGDLYEKSKAELLEVLSAS